MKNEKAIGKIEKAYHKYEKKMKSGGMSIRIENKEGNFTWKKETGDLSNDNQYCVASVTKMFTTAVILQLVDEKKLRLSDYIESFFDTKTIEGLHVYQEADYSSLLTIEHLITQTSGLPDYFTEACPGHIPMEQRLDIDVAMTLAEELDITKRLSPHFAPASKNKAFYSDVNWDVLPHIIEAASGVSIEEHFIERIFKPLGLNRTYLFTGKSTFDFPGFYLNGIICKPSNLLASWPASGGIISTNTEMITFLRAFWNGELFKPTHFEKMNKYHFTQYFPMQYGMGVMRWKYPGVPALIGHSGSTGVVCYYAPDIEMYISGCINEMNEVKATLFLIDIAKALKELR